MNTVSQWLLRENEGVLGPNDRSTHTYVIGQPGTGKSRALESWIMQDVEAGHGVGVIDPHGDLFQNLLIRLSFKPDVWERIVIIDPCNKTWVTPFNPLEAVSNYSQERMALFLTDIIGKIWRLDLASAPRTMWLLSNTFLALSNLDLTLLHLPKFLLDRNYREGLLPRLTNPSARSFFHYEFPKNPGAAHQWASPVLNKIGGLIFDPDTSLMLAGKGRISFRQIMDRQLILLVNLPKGILGEGISALMGAFIVAHLQKAALARANTRTRNPYYLYLDEFQNYTTDNIKDILSESRKYSLSMTLVNQYLEQLTPDIRHAILNTSGGIVSFRVGHSDALELAKEIFSNRLQSGQDDQRLMSFSNPGSMQAFPTENQHRAWDDLAQSLVRMPAREFWHKRRGLLSATKQKSFDMHLPPITNEVRRRIYRLVSTSARLYSRSKTVVQQDVDSYSSRINFKTANNTQVPLRDVDEEFPMWGV